MVGGEEQAHLPRWPPQRWWMVTLKIVSLSLLMFPSSTGGKWQFDFEPETRPLPAALTPEGELFGVGGGGEGGKSGLQATSDEVLCGAVRIRSMSRAARAMFRGVCGVYIGECAVCRRVCGVFRGVWCVGECAVCMGVCGV